MARYLSSETQPFGKWKGIPIYLTTVLAAVFVIGLFVSAMLAASRSPWLGSLMFELPQSSMLGWLSVLTYPFIEVPTFFTPLGIICFYFWAVGIETHLGRGPLVKLLLLLTVFPAAVIAVLWFGFDIPGGIGGNFMITAGLLVAFATLYPNAEWAGWIPFKWVAFACIVCGSLMLIADRNWSGVAQLWSICLVAHFCISQAIEQEHDDYVPFGARLRGWFRRKPRLRALPNPQHTTYRERPRRREIPAAEKDEDTDSEVDALLDKIAKNGIASLTPAERARLEKEREELLKKERR